MSKEALRQRIAAQTERFLRHGGQIEVVEPRRVCPRHMKWIERLGMDYSTWDEIGGKEWYSRDGSYQLDPEDFEED